MRFVYVKCFQSIFLHLLCNLILSITKLSLLSKPFHCFNYILKHSFFQLFWKGRSTAWLLHSRLVLSLVGTRWCTGRLLLPSTLSVSTEKKPTMQEQTCGTSFQKSWRRLNDNSLDVSLSSLFTPSENFLKWETLNIVFYLSTTHWFILYVHLLIVTNHVDPLYLTH